jgi:undecaprenyl-phosphate 4-deoxy-4-formamido-L-arabinose transferase
MMDVSVVIPIFNEEASLEELVTRVLQACRHAAAWRFEVILVDDGSTDRSPQLIREAAAGSPEVVGVLLNRNYGQHAAVTAGLERSHGEIVVTLDGDLQNPPEEIPRLVATMQEGYDVVGTIRVPREDSWFRRSASFLTNQIVQRTTGVRMHDYGCMLRAYRRPIVDAMLQCGERSTFIPVLANSFASRTTEIEVAHQARRQGVSKYHLPQLLRLQLDLVTSMTTFPLRVLTVVGGTLAALGFALGMALVVARLIFGAAWAVGGVFTLFAVLFFLVGAQFMGLGLLGEYLGRIYAEVRARPRYFVREVVNRTEPETDRPPASAPATVPAGSIAGGGARSR